MQATALWLLQEASKSHDCLSGLALSDLDQGASSSFLKNGGGQLLNAISYDLNLSAPVQ